MTAVLLRDTKYAIRDTFLKALIASLLYCFIAILLANPAHAQTASQSATNSLANSPSSYLANSSFSPQSPHTASMAVYNFSHAISCIVTGRSPIAPCLEYKFLGNSPRALIKSIPVLSTENNNYGLIGLALASMDVVYQTPPLQTGEFLANLGSEIGLVKETHAQVGGTGGRVLSGIFFLWETSRNFSYLAMILIFLIVGLMVMFRQKLNPQTVVSIQLALPGLVIGLVLITFSYFIASLITDISYVGTGVVSAYFQTAFGGKATPLLEALETENVVSIVSSFAGKLDSTSVQKTVNSLIGSLSEESSSEGIINFSPKTLVKLMLSVIFYQVGNGIGTASLGLLGSAASGAASIGAGLAITAGAALMPWIIPVAVGGIALTALSGPLAGAGLAGFAFSNPGWAGSVLVDIILVFVILFALVRILMALLSAYLSILILTIISPFIFLFSSIPGNSGAASSWIRSMLANSLTFPAIMAALYFAAFLMGPNKIPAFNIQSASSGGSSLNVYAQGTPSGGDLTSKYTLPGLGLLDNSLLNKGIGIMVLLSASAIPGLLKQSIGKGDRAGGAFEQALNQGISGGRGYSTALSAGVGAYAGTVTAAHTEWFGRSPLSSNAQRLAMITRGRKDAGSDSDLPWALTSKEEEYQRYRQGTRQSTTPGDQPGSTASADEYRRRLEEARKANELSAQRAQTRQNQPAVNNAPTGVIDEEPNPPDV